MSALTRDHVPLRSDRRRVPGLVIVSFYAWMPLIVAQSILLGYLLLTFAQAARVGGPAWDVLFVDPPTVTSLVLMITLEVAFVVRLRDGSRLARVVLAALAGVSAAFAFLVGIPRTGTRMPVVQTTAQVLGESVPVDVTLVLRVLTAIALVAAVLPFLPAASSYFVKTSVSPTQDAAPVVDRKASRRRAPRQVILAFIFWWPLIIAEVGGLFLLARTIAEYVGYGSATAVTLMFAVGVGVPLLVLIGSQAALAVMALRGSRRARAWMLGLTIATTISVGVPVALSAIASPVPGTALFSWIVCGIVLLALAGAVLTFLGPAARYFDQRPDAVLPADPPLVDPVLVDPAPADAHPTPVERGQAAEQQTGEVSAP